MTDVSNIDVEKELANRRTNITARRWLDDPYMISRITQVHNNWNKDHLTINQPDMIYTLETHIDIFLDQPEWIEIEKKWSGN